MSHANGQPDHYCGITDSWVVSCRCPQDPDELRKELHSRARFVEQQGPEALDVPDEWRGFKRFLREQRYTT
jgi:hypothetical protein